MLLLEPIVEDGVIIPRKGPDITFVTMVGMDKANKIAIVTGGAMGYKSGRPSIGGAISIRLAKDGCKVT